MKLAICVSGWHFPKHFYEMMSKQIVPEGWQVELHCVAHRKPSEAHDKDIKLGESIREKMDKVLYQKIVSEKELKEFGWNYKLYPNTIGDWGCSNQWLADHDYKQYDAFLFTHDDNLLPNNQLLIAGITALKDFEIVSNSVGMPAGWLRGSCEFFSRSVMDKLGGKFDLSETTLTREGKTDTPDGISELNDWNSTVYPMMRFIESNKIKIGALSPYYRISPYCLEGERGWIHKTHGINTAQEELGLKEFYGV